MIVGAEAYSLGHDADLSKLGLRAPDLRTFVVRLTYPTPFFLSMLGLGSPFLPVYRPSLEKFRGVHQRGTGWTREGNLVSNGPFVLSRWRQNQVIVVARNPHYWDAPAGSR